MTGRRRRIAAGLLAASAALLIAGCGGGADGSSASKPLISRAACAANRAAGTITYVSPFGFDASAGILDVFAAQRLGYFAAMCLDVRLISNSQNSTALVSAGRAQVTNIGSAADLMGAVANGANLVGIATYADTSDYAVLTRPDITDLRQLEGKTLGYHFVVPVTIREMLHNAGVTISRVRLVATTNYDPNQLVQGRFDAIQAYRSNEPLVLRSEHQQFREFDPGSFGVPGTFNVQVVNRGLLAAHRQAAADFLRAELHGFDYCVAHPDQCIAMEAAYAKAAGAEFPVGHERAVWGFESALVRNHTLAGAGVGVQSGAEWAPEADAVRRYGLVRSLPAMPTYQDTALVASLYRGQRLIWP